VVTELRMPDVHGATMAPIAVASLTALAGLSGCSTTGQPTVELSWP
jgi:hypothetical protein